MPINHDMMHAQTTNGLFNDACKVLEGVSKMKERIAELEKENESTSACAKCPKKDCKAREPRKIAPNKPHKLMLFRLQ